jgi:hypothetical protein
MEQTATILRDDTEVTEAQQKFPQRWKPGQSGNPAGRPRGVRNALSTRFLDDIYETWQKHGITALERAAKEEPAKFVNIVSRLLPRELDVQVSHDLTASVLEFAQAWRIVRGSKPLLIEAEDAD